VARIACHLGRMLLKLHGIIVLVLITALFAGCQPKRTANSSGAALSAKVSAADGLLAFSCVQVQVNITGDAAGNVSRGVVTVAFSSANVFFYSDSNCANSISSAPFAAGQSSSVIYVVAREPGSQEITATVETDTPTVIPFKNGLTSMSFTSGTNQNVPEESRATNALVVLVSNLDGSPAIGVLVDARASDDAGNANPNPSLTDHEGKASFIVTAPFTDGTFTVTCATEPSPGIYAIASFTTIPN
jgi:hypothetical protein